ncbi:alpha/beta hydrolase [Aureimonas flava]|uniref:Alpha/beta hydrolase n=1 Tax=Aureimonas flava TaxID=2320271 RepID=A0A3A1WJ46_9HYPH|nr:alpha/beta hydrolase [Aureimonas flava]RIX98503.1 alpha/beta hydrolase [Aureimonas flava]
MQRSADKLFHGFRSAVVATDDGPLAVLTGGSGPPVLLLHGYPQTRAAWHLVAGGLAARRTVVLADLPGYGDSPLGSCDGSKRMMAARLVALMRALGHRRFAVVGHDRGGRVAYRMALDHPDAVEALTVVAVVPTPEMWEGADLAFGLKAWHWYMLAQPAPLPEALLGAAPSLLLDTTLEAMAGGPGRLDPLALADYHAAFARPEVRHGICQDYRAGAAADHAHDLEDRRAGRRIAAPVQVLWPAGKAGPGGRDVGDIWRPWCESADVFEVGGGHLLPETASEAVLAALVPFLERTGAGRDGA